MIIKEVEQAIKKIVRMPAGRELDRIFAERVRGLSLIPPREIAMVAVGARHTDLTGPVFKLDNGKEIHMPPGDHLVQPKGTTNFNDRYFYQVALFLGKEIEAEVDAFRLDPEPYSTDIATVWKGVEEKFGKETFAVYRMHGEWDCVIRSTRTTRQKTAPLAICKTAILAVMVGGLF